MGRKRIETQEPVFLKLKVQIILINGFPYYYCLAEDRYINLYHEKCPHLKERHPEFVVLEFSQDEIDKRFNS